ncbi:hypothetical protein [Afifella sp. YEN Y35]|uniref:hypothetical protein n=1 Tax=Afifella sp. YEN Y35 TaxID=3388337 RepID=UPI0039E0660E
MSEELMWLVGALVSVVSLIGGAIVRDRYQSDKVSTSERRLSDQMKDGDDRLHERINRVRDELSENYVRRPDLEGHLARLDSQLQELRSDGKAQSREMASRMDAQRQEMTERLDAIMAALTTTARTPRRKSAAPKN